MNVEQGSWREKEMIIRKVYIARFKLLYQIWDSDDVTCAHILPYQKRKYDIKRQHIQIFFEIPEIQGQH